MSPTGMIRCLITMEIRNLVTPRYIEAPLENPLLFLRVKEEMDEINEKWKWCMGLQNRCRFTFSSEQHIPVCSCSSFPQVRLGNYPTSWKHITKTTLTKQVYCIMWSIKSIATKHFKHTGKLIWVEGPQYLSAAKS